MEVFYKAAPLAARVAAFRQERKSIGFVPTMGALHEGHLSLVRFSRQQNDVTVVSIFVNPTQFNDKSDLERYPRMPEKDSALLEHAGCDILYMPDVNEIYPEPDTRVFDFGGLDKVMEGKQRPGHFNGVAQVVTRLFDMVNPHRAYFGLKDFQQVAIIRKVMSDLQYPVEIVSCPIVRECDGLAMSSRNMLLSGDDRKRALVLSQSLFLGRERMKQGHPVVEVKKYVEDQVNSAEGVDLEYFEIIDSTTLLPAQQWYAGRDVIGCIAARVGKVRLIDNINFSS
ncbi:MAG: pantoate--beta-alanine ligase [Bacteroidales bacterium]|nr:pantoate--beta-alanine ligase [Bacteroidales bacterium]